jgi:hypothetical protein
MNVFFLFRLTSKNQNFVAVSHVHAIDEISTASDFYCSTLLCLLAKIKCSICSYRLNRSIRLHCRLYRLVNFYGTRVSVSLLTASHVVRGIALSPCDDSPSGHSFVCTLLFLLFILSPTFILTSHFGAD